MSSASVSVFYPLPHPQIRTSARAFYHCPLPTDCARAIVTAASIALFMERLYPVSAAPANGRHITPRNFRHWRLLLLLLASSMDFTCDWTINVGFFGFTSKFTLVEATGALWPYQKTRRKQYQEHMIRQT